MENPSISSPFAILGMEPSFDIDETILQQNYFERQSLSHPDRFAKDGQLDHIAAGAASAELNQAYHKIRYPVSRAEVLIRLLGATVPGQDGSTIQDPATLSEALEIREELSETKTPEELHTLRQSVDAHFERYERSFSKAWENKNTEDMKKIYTHLIFLRKTIEEIKDLSIQLLS